MNNRTIYYIETLHEHDASWNGVDSAILFARYKKDNYNFKEYKYPQNLEFSKAVEFCNNYTVVQSQNFHPKLEKMIHQFKPLHVLRYMLHEGLLVSEYDTNKRTPGYVVEALCWTNGMIHRVRQDTKKEFEIYEIGLYLAPLTAKMMGLPDV